MPALLLDRLRFTLSSLLRVFDQRQRGQEEYFKKFTHAEESTREKADKALQQRQEQRDRELAEFDSNYDREVARIEARLAAEEQAQKTSFTEAVARLDEEEKQSRARLEAELKDAFWTADSLLEGGQKRVQEQQDTLQHKVKEVREKGEKLWSELQPLLTRFEIEREDLKPEKPVPPAKGESARDLQAFLDQGQELVTDSLEMRLLGWISWPMQAGIGLWVILLAAAPALFLRPWPMWLGGGLGVALGIILLQRHLLVSTIRNRIWQAGEELAVLLIQAQQLGETLLSRMTGSCKVQLAQIQQQHVHDRKKAEGRYLPRLEQLDRKVRSEQHDLEKKHQSALQQIRHRAQQALEQVQQRYQQEREALASQHEQALEKIKADSVESLRSTRQRKARAEQNLASHWESGCRQFLASVEELQHLVRPADQVAGSNGSVKKGFPEALPFGNLSIDLPHLAEEYNVRQLDPLPKGQVQVPTFLPFPRSSALVLQAHGQGKVLAIQALQTLMLRFLTTLPPGKVRFTILDPVGLGDNFAAFMHLADHDEALVTSRIWTETNHIEKQLSDLTLHMENVIQKYLRSEFSSIEDYNEQAGEVAEPYRVLVVANFPVNFTPQAARRLVSIIQSGASCGVYALISADGRQPMPQGFELEELTSKAFSLRWQGTRFVTNDPEMDRFPLSLETPPDNDRVINLVRQIGLQAKDASRVQVPFSYIAPSGDEIWTSDSRRGINVPLGRAGAVRRLALQLGQGTSQHVLVAGKTGSGKSTLWHTLILNLALRYSPDEIELYLIDFKKGVEFKLYSEHQLPHARVIAIESEREFGLSVLQRLDGILKERGDCFRDAGVNDVAGYRQAHPDEPFPRIMLIVDEFQEFFIEDDRVSQDAALLMDRLVRQGRAFGMHILLGSQTLGGAYSLARSTIDQMAVRIALQCSDSDAQYILGKDNTAARLLSRPGEAIYNNAAGALEGNDIFQVVWLTDEQREQTLRSLHQRAEAIPGRPPIAPPLVFEGNAPADLENNPQLKQLLAQAWQTQAPETRAAKAWLGEAIAIKDPTAAVFRQRTGCNLLIVGQNEEMALALMASSLISLALQHRPEQARFFVLDGTGIEEVTAGFLDRVMEGWPHAMKRVDRGEVGPTLAGLADEMNQRLKGTATDRGARYLLIHGLQRFREFRRTDDDMGFSRRGAERTVSPLEHLQAILRDGPGVGIYVLTWCDMLVNLNRTLDRQGLRECGLRVLFQMSAADSSQLLDSPAASKLGRNRALFFHDEMAQPEKFRPYGLPSLEWLAEIKKLRSQPAATAV